MNLIQIAYGVPVATSEIVAEVFEKEHFHVIRDIEDVISKLLEVVAATDESTNPKSEVVIISKKREVSDYFIQSTYMDAKGEARKQYLLTEEGFALVAMGFTGVKAFQFKIQFLDKFKEVLHENARLQQAEISRMSNLVDSAERLERKTEDLQDTIDTLRSENRELGEKLDHVNPGKATVADVQRKTERRILSDYTKMINKKANRVAREIKGVRKWASNAGYAGEIVLETHLGNIETELQPFTY